MTLRFRLGLLGVVVLGTTLAVVSCTERSEPDPLEPTNASVRTLPLGLAVSAAQQDSSVVVTVTIQPGSDAGRGGLTGYLVLAAGGTPNDQDSVQVASTVRVQTIVLGPYRYRTTQAGTACVKALRTKTNSAYVCKSWTATLGDVAPPPPIVGG